MGNESSSPSPSELGIDSEGIQSSETAGEEESLQDWADAKAEFHVMRATYDDIGPENQPFEFERSQQELADRFNEAYEAISDLDPERRAGVYQQTLEQALKGSYQFHVQDFENQREHFNYLKDKSENVPRSVSKDEMQEQSTRLSVARKTRENIRRHGIQDFGVSPEVFDEIESDYK